MWGEYSGRGMGFWVLQPLHIHRCKVKRVVPEEMSWGAKDPVLMNRPSMGVPLAYRTIHRCARTLRISVPLLSLLGLQNILGIQS